MQLMVPAAANATFTGNGSTLHVVGLNVDGATFDNVPLATVGGVIAGFDNVTFQNMSTAATQFSIRHVGTAAPLVFSGLSFLTTPTTGLYLQAEDTAPGGDVLTIQLPGSTPADGSTHTSAAGGAVVVW
jgi:hypothetical protein